MPKSPTNPADERGREMFDQEGPGGHTHEMQGNMPAKDEQKLRPGEMPRFARGGNVPSVSHGALGPKPSR